MKKRKYEFLFFISTTVFLSAALLQSCSKENIENKFFSESVIAKEYYFTRVLPVLNSKCFSCHNYHNSSTSRYDTFSKAVSMAGQMASRTTSAHGNTIMPPPAAAPLTEEQKQVFLEFLRLVRNEDESSATPAASDSKDYGVSISWTAYKFPNFFNRVGVTGTFDKIFITYKKKEAANIYEFLSDAEILISTNSANIGNDVLKSSNVINHFFAYFTPVIHARVVEINSSSKKAKVKFTMNGLSQEVTFAMEEIKEDLVFTGQINDIEYFNSKASLDALQRECGKYHENKIWPDISLKAEIKNFRKFSVSRLH